MAIDRYRGDYAFLSNFYYAPLTVRIEYSPGKFHRLALPTLEHAYQIHKLQRFSDVLIVQRIIDPGDARWAVQKMAQREDWHARRLPVMTKLLDLKFWLNSEVFMHYDSYVPELTQNLLNTNDEVLIEGNSWGDTFWGVCNGVGENNLGKLQMQRRSRLREIIARFTGRMNGDNNGHSRD